MGRIKGILTERLGLSLPGERVDADILGTYTFGEIGTDVTGNIRLYTENEDGQGNDLATARFVLDDEGFLLNDGLYTAGQNIFFIENARISPRNGMAYIAGHLQSLRPAAEEEYKTSLNFSSRLEFVPITMSIQQLIDGIGQGDIFPKKVTGTLSITDMAVFTYEKLGNLDIDFVYDAGHFELAGRNLSESTTFSSISGYYGIKDNIMDFRIVPGTYPLGVHVHGYLGDIVSLEIDELAIPLRYISYLMWAPNLIFLDGEGSGRLLVQGASSQIQVFGQITADRLDMTSFWTPDIIVSAKNPVLTLSENMLASGRIPVLFTNKVTGKTFEGFTEFSADLDFVDYTIRLSLENSSIPILIPLPPAGLVVSAAVRGDLLFQSIPHGIIIGGDAYISDTRIDFGLPDDLPFWYLIEGFDTLFNLDMTTERNVGFSFPNAENPILEANILPGQRLSIIQDTQTGEMMVRGDVGIRSGSIYYFRKDFHITEGTLSFPDGQFIGQSLPLIDLRARIREYDADGDRVDVYLILENSTLDNLNPRFESSPSKDAAEILQLLGENFLGNASMGDATVSSVASLAAAATDVISRIGIIDAGMSFGLNSSIKKALGLDMFSIRSNILQNVVFEALPGFAFSNVSSPVARYLDDTSLFIGKFLTDDLFLQGTIHVTAQEKRNNSLRRIRFINDELWLDTEFSLEWNNPLATFTIFTQPSELSIFGISDTIGISVTKRISW